MFTSQTFAGSTRARRLIIAAIAVVLMLGATVAYSLWTYGEPAARRAPVVSRSSIAPVSPAAIEPDSVDPVSPAVAASDPQAFARQVAAALFSWDSAATVTMDELTERLIAVADPTGESSAGLRADIANYLPNAVSWTELRRYETRQWLEISTAEVPELWATAVEQAGPDGLLPGTTAYTVRGVRHRTGLWEGDPVSSAHDVAFTVFIVCEPSYPECHLLRLSLLDQPLG